MFSGHWKLSGHLNILTKRWYRFPFCVPLFQYLLNIVYHSEPLIYLSLCFIYNRHPLLSVYLSTFSVGDCLHINNKNFRCQHQSYEIYCLLNQINVIVSYPCEQIKAISQPSRTQCEFWYSTYKIISWLYQKYHTCIYQPGSFFFVSESLFYD